MNEIWAEFLDFAKKERTEKNLIRTLPSIEDKKGKTIIINNKRVINMSGNDYLGLSNDKRIINKGYELAKRYGAGSTGSRLMSGNLKFIEDFEKELAEILKTERSLIFNSGWHANIALITTFADKNTTVFCDRLNHASIYDGIKLSGASMIRYHHNNMKDLEEKLNNDNTKKKIIITESVFSMDGDISCLEDIVDLSQKHSALLIVDEAHGFGVFGERCTGIIEEKKLQGKVDLIMATFGKACGVMGSFVAGDSLLIEHLINHARPFIFSTALNPFTVGAAREAIKIIQKERPGKRLIEISNNFREELKKSKISYGSSSSHIIPIITGSNERSLELKEFLFQKGFFCQAIRPPTVLPGTARIRLSLNLLIKEEDLKLLLDSIKEFFK